MVEANYILPSERLSLAIGRFVDEKYPGLDRDAHSQFIGLIDSFETQPATTVKITDVYLMKCLCETIFRDTIVPKILGKGG